MVNLRNALNILEKNPEGTKPLGTLRLRWDNNIKIDLKEIR
jgi:hypothetical protein